MAAARRLALMALLPAALAGCEQAAETDAPAGKRAAGEVLGGTISDEMIPLEQLRSQSPPMRAVPGEGDGSGGNAVSDDTGDNDSAEPAPAEAAAEPAPDPAPAEEG